MVEKFLLDGGLAGAALGVEDREQQGKNEKDDAKPDRESLQNVRGLGSENVFRHAAAEGRAEAFVFRALHEDDHDHEKADEHVERDKYGYKNRHGP